MVLATCTVSSDMERCLLELEPCSSDKSPNLPMFAEVVCRRCKLTLAKTLRPNKIGKSAPTQQQCRQHHFALSFAQVVGEVR